MNQVAPIVSASDNRNANREYLGAEIARLRLLLHRRALWLRRRWKHDASQDYMSWRISDAQADWLLQGEDEHAELAFYDTDPDAKAISSALAAIETEIDALGDSLRQAGMLPTLDVVARLFGLSRFERDVFLLALAPELDSSFERLYAYVLDDLTQRHATAQLAQTLLRRPEDIGHAHDCFMPHGTLRRYRLLTLDDTTPTASFPNRALRLDERMLDFMIGNNQADERLECALRAVPLRPISSADRQLVDRVVSWSKTPGDQLLSRAVNFIDPNDVGPLHIAAAICAALGIALYQLNLADLPTSQPDRREFFALIEREAILRQMALYLDLGAPGAADRNDVVQEFDRLQVFCIVRSTARWPAQRETLAIPIIRSDAAAQAETWQQAMVAADVAPSGEIGPLVEQFDLSPAQIWRALSVAGELSALRSPDAKPTIDDLWRACEQETAPKLDDLAQRIIPSYGWDDIVLPPESFSQLQEIGAQVAHRAQVYGEWGFGAKLSRGRGITALFAGASGTGKTMAAEVLANSLHLDLYRIDLAGVVSKYIGETERNLRRIFGAAERGGAILFFDEADALFGKRSEVKDSHDRYANIEVNYLLQAMEEFRGLAILATNRKSSLDSAFVRRLRFIVDFTLPDAAHRQRIWRRVFPPEAELNGIDPAWLARLEIPGGHIRNVALAAAFLAASEQAPIGMLHVMRAARREFTKMDRIIQESDFGSYYVAVTS